MVTRSSTDIVERLRFDAARCELQFSKGVAGNIDEAADEIERLRAALTTASGEAATATETCGFCTGKGYVVKAHFDGGTYTADCPACTVCPSHQPVTKADQP